VVEVVVVFTLFKVPMYSISKIFSKSLFTLHGDNENTRSNRIVTALYKPLCDLG
jgi:hypothetical protein